MEFILENAHLKIKIKEKGAELAGITRKKDGMELMWQADPQFWGRHSCILFPIVGKVKNGNYQAEGRSFEMGQHGIARDLPFQLEAETATAQHFLLLASKTTLAQYPYRFELRIKYQLDNNQLGITYEVTNVDTQPIWFSLGGHPAFNCPLKAGESRSDYQLVFSEKETAERHLLNQEGLYSGQTETVLSNSGTLPLTENLFDKDALVFKNLSSDAVTLAHKKEGAVFTFHFPGFPYLGIWSKDRQSPFICIEPWYGLADYADHNQDFTQKEGTIELAEGKSFGCTHTVEVH